MSLYNWPIGFSIGVVSFAVPPATTDETRSLADKLMYKVRRKGKNNIFFEEYAKVR